MPTFTFTLFFFFLSASVYSQLYTPIDTINVNKNQLLDFFDSKTKKLESEFRSYSQTDRRFIRRFVRERNNIFKALTEDSYLLFDEELEGYINGLLQNLVEKNQIKGDGLRIFLSRDTSPNAYSLGDGNFVFTLSLLNRLETEDELLFIIAHEVSHYYLDHLKKQVKERMRLINTTEYISNQRELKKSRYNRFTKSLEQYRELQYGDRNTRRMKELQADSLGFELFKKVAINPNDAVSALQKTDTLSPAEMLKIDLEILKNHFSTPKLPFNDAWTTGYDFSKYNYQTGKIDIFGTHRDSLKTHPELRERISRLKMLMPDTQITSKNKSTDFERLKEIFRLEDVYSHYCLDEYGRGIYLILQLQNLENVSEKQHLFYSHMLSLFYKELADARRAFKFKKYVDDIDYQNFSEEYILFLTIIDNLRSSELQELSNHYKIN